ncbi:MAG TPA: MoaD/ThiS family protein [Candidatus Binatia bacterium]|jgi:molybdopterin converting factor small subunit|nr:MoaD/ThiS family protein [Candidatus Binatia bacterium]
MASVVLRVPPTLAQFCAGERVLTVSGATVDEALGDATTRHPLLRVQLLDEGGRVREHLHLFLNDTDVRRDLDTALREGDELTVLRAMSGGSR